MKTLFFLVMAVLAESSAPSGYSSPKFDTRHLEQDPRWEGWKKWPVREAWISIYVPPGFKITRSYIANSDEGLVFDVRLRSSDGNAEFALKVALVSERASSISARLLAWDFLSSREVVAEDHLNKVESDVAGETAYEEEIVGINTNPRYTRYFKRCFSMSDGLFAESVLWEFKVTDDLIRLKYQELYQQFKKSLLQLIAE
jgi:hypothetical protein